MNDLHFNTQFQTFIQLNIVEKHFKLYHINILLIIHNLLFFNNSWDADYK